MAVDTVVGASVLKLLREEMAGMARHIIEDTDDPVTKGIALNSSRVSRKLGRRVGGTTTSAGDSAFEAQHPITFGRAGALKYGDMGGSTSGSGTDVITGPPPRLDKSTTYPDASIAPQRNTEWLTVGLKWLQGNLTIHRHQLLALEAGSPVEDFLANWLRDPIEIIHQQMTNDFFTAGDGNVGKVKTGAVHTAVAGQILPVTLSTKARPLWRGQMLNYKDFTESNKDTVKAASGSNSRWMVTRVHSFSGTLGETIVALENIDATAFTSAVSDTLHLDGAITRTGGTDTIRGVLGLGEFVKDPGTAGAHTLHGLEIQTSGSVAVYPELFSYVDSPSTDRWPTPSVFEKAMDEICDRGFAAPDRWIVSRGVRTLFYQTEGLYKTYNTDLAGPVQRGADGGITGPAAITSEKGTAEMVISAFGDRDVAYGIRPDSFIHYAPEGLDAVQFVGDSSLLGNSMFLVARSSDNVTPVYEAPFDFYFERGCLAPQTLAKVGGLKYHSEVVA
jgi:hypothetical protein